MAGKNKASETAGEIILRKRNKALDREGYANLFLRLILLVVILGLLFTRLFLLTQVSGNDMFPAIKDGDLVLAYRLQGDYMKNDPVIYSVDGQLYAGRIVAREGDTVILDESGDLLVNGTRQTGEILYSTYARDKITYPYTVEEGAVFILGDYRTEARDSRDFGAISLKDVKGKILSFLRRRDI